MRVLFYLQVGTLAWAGVQCQQNTAPGKKLPVLQPLTQDLQSVVSLQIVVVLGQTKSNFQPILKYESIWYCCVVAVAGFFLPHLPISLILISLSSLFWSNFGYRPESVRHKIYIPKIHWQDFIKSVVIIVIITNSMQKFCECISYEIFR